MHWLLNIVGVVFLSMLFDVVFPNGKLNSLCKSIFGLFAMFVIIKPVLNIKTDVFDTVYVDNELLNNINNSKCDALVLKITSHLESLGMFDVDVEIDSNLNYDEFVVENIYVDVTKLVLNKNFENINTNELIAVEINKISNVDIERIIVYG